MGSNSNNNSNSDSDVPPNGRELAIEALIDLDDRGPSFRVGRIVNEAPSAALAARPNKITRAALFDVAQSLSQYQLKTGDYLQHQRQHKYQLKHYQANDNDNSDAITPSATETGDVETDADTENATTSKDVSRTLFKDMAKQGPPSQKQKERVMKHHSKIVLAKHNLQVEGDNDNDDVKGSEEGNKKNIAAETMKVTAFPPPQLVSSLRKIFGHQSTDRLDDLEDSDGSTSGSNLLPSLIQSIVDHPIFSSVSITDSDSTNDSASNDDNTGNKDKVEGQKSDSKKESKTSDEKDDEEGDEDGVVTKQDEEEQHEKTSKNSPIINSPVGNLEAIIGNACKFDSDDVNNTKNDEILLGILLAAFSVLTSCVSDGVVDEDAEDSSSIESCIMKTNDMISSLQVVGPLSLHYDTALMKSTKKHEFPFHLQSFSNLLLDPVLMNYFMEAAAVCQERDDIEKENALKAMSESKTDANTNANEDKKENETKDDEKEKDDGDNSGEERPAEVEPVQLFHEPHGYSFVEDEEEEDDSSSRDDDSSSSSSSEDENEEVEDETAQNELERNSIENEDTEGTKDENIDESTNAEESKDASAQEAVIDSNQETEQENFSQNATNAKEEGNCAQDADMDATLLEQALALSLGENTNIPELPTLPSYPDKESQPEDISTLNPSSFSNFGKLPAPSVLTSLLNLALRKVENQKTSCHNYNATIHVMIAILHILSSARADTIKGLGDLYQKLKECEGQYKVDDDNDGEDTTEDDDPAFATSPHAASAYSSSGSLEEKGMLRKAAAAAHSASIQRTKIQQDINTLIEAMKLHSLNSYLVIKCLRSFLQGSSSASIYPGTDQFLSTALPTITRVRLSASLATFMSSSLSKQYHIVSLYSKKNELDEISLPTVLLLEATSLWGESTPLIHPSTADLENQLQRSLRQCFPSVFDEKSDHPNLDSLSVIKYPWSDFDANWLKLDSMCRRLRSQELLDCFVSSPKIYNKSTSAYESGKMHLSIYQTLATIHYDVLPNCNSSISENVKSLFLALHHRCTQNLLLWKKPNATYLDAPFNNVTDSSKQMTDAGDGKVYLAKSHSFAFDSAKCADSIALISPPTSDAGSLSVHQRASKVWGTVLSSKIFNPKTGVHRWAVRLDKCERGHVFVGVATSRASKKTYVGGDKYSWGVIGTQALWHERRKIRSDYGSTFRTGSTVIVSLDTDAGTLSFGILHDAEPSTGEERSSSESLSLLSPSHFDEQEHDASGFVEDWGVAFEGLPLDAKLFPAVGLYQRDDKVTLLSVTKNKRTQCDSASLNDLVHGPLLYPEKIRSSSTGVPKRDAKHVEAVRSWNSSLCNESISFVSSILNQTTKHLGSKIDSQSKLDFFQTVLPSVASSLALYPLSIPTLSGRFSMILLPLIQNCIAVLEERINDSSRLLSPVAPMKSGTWTIRAAPCTSSSCAPDEYEEYIVDLEQNGGENENGSNFQGKGVGTSGKSINCKVSIVGACRGSSIQFVEEWKDECDALSESILPTSSCVIDGRLNLHGTRFEGVYKNVHYGKCGSIAGLFNDKSISTDEKEEVELNSGEEMQQCLVTCSSLLGMAASHLASALSRGAPALDVGTSMNYNYEESTKRLEELNKLVSSSSILSTGLSVNVTNPSDIESCFKKVISYFSTSDEKIKQISVDASLFWKEKLLIPLLHNCGKNEVRLPKPNLDEIHKADTTLAPQCGGFGSLSQLEPESYQFTREKIIAVLLYHTGTSECISSDNTPEIQAIWRAALRIIETGVRSSLLSLPDGASRRSGCGKYCKLADIISDFLLTVFPQPSSGDTIKNITEIYDFISRKEDVSCIIQIMKAESRRSILDCMSMCVIQKCINKNVKTLSTIESIMSSWYLDVGSDQYPMIQMKGKSSLSAPKCADGVHSHANQLKNEVLSSILLYITDIFNENKRNSIEVSLQSLVLMIVPILLAPSTTYSTIIKSTAFWNIANSLITLCKKDLESKSIPEVLVKANTTPSENSAIIYGSMRRHTNLSILNCVSSVLHVLLFHLHNEHHNCTPDEVSISTKMPIAILKNEINVTLSRMKLEHTSKSKHKMSLKAVNECGKWISSVKERSEISIQLTEGYGTNASCIPTGVSFIVAHGGVGINSQSSSSYKSPQDVKSVCNSSERYLVRLLDILSSMVRSSMYPYWIQNDNDLIKNLLGTVVGNNDENLLPLRFRLRILRLLRFMIPKSKPDDRLVTMMLKHMGDIVLPPTNKEMLLDAPEMECYLEVKEITSLIRSMYISDESTFVEGSKWRNSINSALTKDSSDNDRMQRGVNALFGGMPDKLTVGSCVLLKPSPASNLTAVSSQASMKSSSGSSRSKTNSGSMAPVAASSGTEGIVAGLCRRDALAGRISDVDIMKGMCEIVLFDRCGNTRVESCENLVSGMSVRVIQVPMQEVVVADEVALLIDREFPVSKVTSPSLLEALRSTTSMLEQMNDVDNKPKKSNPEVEFNNVCDTLLSLRSGAVIFSNTELLDKYLQNQDILQNDKSELLSKLLSLGAISSVNDEYSYTNSACTDSLSSLPEYQSRFWYLRGMLLDVKQRKLAFNASPIEKMCTISSKPEVEEEVITTPSKEIIDENSNVTPPRSRQESENVNSEETGEEVSQRRSNAADVSGFHSNSIDTVNDDDEEENEEEESSAARLAEETEAAHLREAAIVQMAELGLPRSWSEYALRRVGGTNIEAAVHFCLERGGDMERLLLEEEERSRRTAPSSSRRRSGPGGTGSSHLLRQLVEMGFPPNWCAEALSSTGHNVDEALTWMIRNGERLSALDEGVDNEEDDEDEGESVDEGETEVDATLKIPDEPMQGEIVKEEEKTGGWRQDIVCPLRSISGRTNIDHKTLLVTGLPTGGFSSVGMKGIPLETGKWYYEAELITDGCLQIGWADSSFSGHCQAERGDGCGDGSSSWAFDGWRRYRWHSTATEWGCRWQEGDIVGCLLDMDNKEIKFTLNGRGEEIGMGLAFSGDGFRPCGGVYACVSFNRREKIRLILGGNPETSFHHPPPPGYKGVGEAVVDFVNEREELLKDEKIIFDEKSQEKVPSRKSYLCDFSDGEHGYELFAWQHRYYGSDASVHLGGRNSRNKGSNKRRSLGMNSPSSANNMNTLYSTTIEARLVKTWAKIDSDEDKQIKELAHVFEEINNGYDVIISDVMKEMSDNALGICILYARKFIMHIAIALSSKFELALFRQNGTDADDVIIAQNLWLIFEKCCGLHAAGWVGEAGAMAVASEALGLAISSHERTLHGSPFSSLLGSGSLKHGDDNGEGAYLPTPALSQFLSSAKVSNEKWLEKIFIDPSTCLASCAEAALGGDVGGSVIFIRQALQNAVQNSSSMIHVLLAVIRRSVRLLSSVEYGNVSPNSNDSDDDDDDDDDCSDSNEMKSSLDVDGKSAPDARFTSFLTGLLLSNPVCLGIDSSTNDVSSQFIANSLFVTWSVGLLSASAPWRMVCAMTVSSILNLFPQSLAALPPSLPTLRNFYSRLYSTVSRRLWAERASVPICSRYAQSFVELSCSVRKAVVQCDTLKCILPTLGRSVDAATPLPLELKTYDSPNLVSSCNSWEWDEGWINCDAGWEVWTGSIEYHAVDWMTPSRSAVRSLTDGGEGPPMLREGCTVMRGLDWDDAGSGTLTGNEDGKDLYEEQKKEKDTEPKEDDESTDDKPSPKKKNPSPKLPVGKVVAIEPWKGIPGLARRVKWNLTNEESVYRFGGDGGRYDISHVEINDKSTRVRKRHPLPESLEQCAARYGFGLNRKFSAILRLRRCGEEVTLDEGEKEIQRDGVLEMPDFGAGILVQCQFYDDGAVAITEKRLLYGAKDSGWEPRFGQPSYVAGTTMVLSMTNITSSTNGIEDGSHYEELLGSSSYMVKDLRNRANGERVRVASEMRLLRDKIPQCYSSTSFEDLISSPLPPPICFDNDFHAPSLCLSRDRRTVTCTAAEGRCTAFGSVGFTKGVHYWEVKIEQADTGSIFIGVAEKPSMDSSSASTLFGSDGQSRLNRWLGWGFVNFRATYSAGAERVYGAHCHAGDTIGVLLDCDAGRLSFFFDGIKYGEHIMNDLGCAYENISPFGFNADGCGSSGAGQGAPNGGTGHSRGGGRYLSNGAVQPKALWPVVGMRHPGDRVTFAAKWMTSQGVDGVNSHENALAVDEILCSYDSISSNEDVLNLPKRFIKESHQEFKRWREGRWMRSTTRGSGPESLSSCGLDIDIDTSPLACAVACASLGLKLTLLPGDHVSVKRSAGRLLELPEDAEILGAYQGRLWYQIVAQKSEGGSLSEGGGRAWFWDESEVVDDSLQNIGAIKAKGIELPLISRFQCSAKGGIKIIYSGGAVVRSDLEIFDGSENIGTIPEGTIIPRKDVLERRMNSCGVVRFRVKFEAVGQGWISSRIRGGKEEAIVEYVITPSEEEDIEEDKKTLYSIDSAKIWMNEFKKRDVSNTDSSCKQLLQFSGLEEFEKCLSGGIISQLSPLQSDSLLTSFISSVADSTHHGDGVEASFELIASALYSSIKSHELLHEDDLGKDIGVGFPTKLYQSAASMFSSISSTLPPLKCLLARVAMLRALNRRVRYALPWLSSRPPQESSAVLGGLSGFGASIERCGKSKKCAFSPRWVQASSSGSRVRDCRSILFGSVKREYLNRIINATTTPTPLSHDEYELPREVRTVRVNRVKARHAMSSTDSISKKKHSVFSQLQSETRGWSGAALRRGHVAKGHGGQKRAFKVKLVGEGVNDYSGPYREVFTDAMREVTVADEAKVGTLGVLDPSPNRAADIGEDRSLFVFSFPSVEGTSSSENYECKVSDEERMIRQHYSSYLIGETEGLRDVEDSISFLGKLASTAVRHGILVDLPLALESVWKPLCEEENNPCQSLKELDLLSSRNFSGESYALPLMMQQQRMLNSFAEGISSVMPLEIFSIFSGSELRDVYCGDSDIDVDLLQKIVEYEGYNKDDTVIQYFWEVLREMSSEERKLFLQFVWARRRLPMKESDFEDPFKIQKDMKSSGFETCPALPSASTCFFSLSLPEYQDKETLKEKLLFAINNVTTMESDYVTNDSEVREGWRGM